MLIKAGRAAFVSAAPVTAGQLRCARRRNAASFATAMAATSRARRALAIAPRASLDRAEEGVAAARLLVPEELGATKVEQRKRVLSGVQPTGSLHLGNYLGAIRNWVVNQDNYESYFFVVDLHAITLPHNPKELADVSLRTAALYLAAGIDPAKSRIFIQSHVRAHTELTWLLNCITPMNWLERMIQFKEKARKQGENVSVGLFDYPVLMAADILLYQAELVPVGEDQTQHLELARDIARRFNDQFARRVRPRVLREPRALLVQSGARVMSLEDGTSKMSKSAESDMSRINLTDDAATIRRKIKRCKTDSATGLTFDDPERPECRNLLSIYQVVTGQTQDAVARECADLTWGRFKPMLADALIEHLTPLQARYADIMNDRAYLETVLRDGADAASEIADRTVTDVKKYLGFALPKH